jgi:hypothetical protein
MRGYVAVACAITMLCLQVPHVWAQTGKRPSTAEYPQRWRSPSVIIQRWMITDGEQIAHLHRQGAVCPWKGLHLLLVAILVAVICDGSTCTMVAIAHEH